jgi:putative transcriptional regulator
MNSDENPPRIAGRELSVFIGIHLWLLLLGLSLFATFLATDSAAVHAAASGPRSKLEKGKLLIASRDLRDPNFSETVILLIAYGPGGAMGVIVNRPSKMKLATVLPSIKQLQKRRDTLYMGGPVAGDHILLLVRAAKEPEDGVPVFEDVYASSSLTVLRQQAQRKVAEDRLHAYAGHAGWAPGQLEAEAGRGDWYIVAADVATVFTSHPKDTWEKLIQRVEGDWVSVPAPELSCAR